jgi:hypothetical protein
MKRCMSTKPTSRFAGIAILRGISGLVGWLGNVIASVVYGSLTVKARALPGFGISPLRYHLPKAGDAMPFPGQARIVIRTALSFQATRYRTVERRSSLTGRLLRNVAQFLFEKRE